MKNTCDCGNVITCEGNSCVVCKGGKQQPTELTELDYDVCDTHEVSYIGECPHCEQENKPEQARYKCFEYDGAFGIYREGQKSVYKVCHSHKELSNFLLSELNNTQPDQVAKECAWKHVDEFDMEYWESSCGEKWSFIEGDPKDNNVRFCQGCGGKVKDIEEPPK